MVPVALDAAAILAEEGIQARVLDMHTVKPLDVARSITAARETGAIVTGEEQVRTGGVGSNIARVVAETYPVPMRVLAIPDVYPESRQRADLLAAHHMTAEDVVAAARGCGDRSAMTLHVSWLKGSCASARSVHQRSNSEVNMREKLLRLTARFASASAARGGSAAALWRRLRHVPGMVVNVLADPDLAGVPQAFDAAGVPPARSSRRMPSARRSMRCARGKRVITGDYRSGGPARRGRHRRRRDPVAGHPARRLPSPASTRQRHRDGQHRGRCDRGAHPEAAGGGRGRALHRLVRATSRAAWWS